jgi:hypothetical protein
MFDLDGSETSWLIYADWLEDQGLDAEHIRMPWMFNDYCYECVVVTNGSFLCCYNGVGFMFYGYSPGGYSCGFVGSRSAYGSNFEGVGSLHHFFSDVGGGEAYPCLN